MSTIHNNPTATAPTYGGATAATGSTAPAGAASQPPREISAASVDALTTEALKQSSTNPAAALETPPPATAESTAAATSALTSIDVNDSSMSIESLIDLMSKLMMQSAQTNRKTALTMRAQQYQQVEGLQLQAAAETRKTKDDVMHQAISKAAFGFATSCGSAFATWQRPNADGTGGSKGWSAGGEVSSGIFKSSGDLVEARFRQDEIGHNAASQQLSALATTHQKIAETTAADGVSTANDQVRSAQDSISKNEQARHDSREKINRL